MSNVGRSVVIWCALSGVAFGQFQFSVPDPNQNDLSESWSVGDTMNIAWKKGWNGVGDALDAADLWITWFRSDSFSALLLENVTFGNNGSYDWKVNVTNDVVRKDPQFVLRLKPHSDPPIYTSTENESPSRGFLLLPGVEPAPSSSTSASASSTSASSTTSTSSATVASLTASPTLTPTATPTSPSTSVDGGSSTNVGAIVGGVIGGLAGLALLGIAWLYLRRRRPEGSGHEAGAHGVKVYYGLRAQPVEIGGTEQPVELSDGTDRTHEMMNESSWKEDGSDTHQR